MDVVRFSDPAAFLELAQAWLLQSEAENNVLLSVARALAHGELVPKETPYLALARDGATLCGCSGRTAPHALMVTRCAAAARAILAKDAVAACPDLPGVWGPTPEVDAFAEILSTLADATPAPLSRQRLYVAAAVRTGLRVPAGALRKADAGERALARQWLQAFVGEASVDRNTDPSERIDRLMRAQGLFFWDDAGPVSMLAVGGRTEHSARVSFVYTPPAARGRGYASAAVAALTAQLLREGSRYCCIYTDLANPTSNRIYQEVGYRTVCDFTHYAFAR